MIIKNAMVYRTTHSFEKQDLYIRDERITDEKDYLLSEDEEDLVIDAEGLYAVPGLVDIHFHGAAGHDFCDGDEEGLTAIAQYEADHGILAISPATMTYPEDRLQKIMKNAAEWTGGRTPCPQKEWTRGTSPCPKGADLVGINMEGPFISPKRLGAQNPEYVMKADVSMVERLNETGGGLIRLVDVAPEEPGNMDFIRDLVKLNEDRPKSERIRISLAHTCADYETALEAFREGAAQLTHLYNAMPGLHHRQPGPIMAAAECGADAEIITDGVHIHPSMVRLAFRLFGAECIILISDSMMATGLEDGTYSLGGQDVTVKGNRASLKEHPDVVAGSVTNLYDCLKTAVLEMGVPLEDGIRAASENPAKAIGVEQDYGTLEPGSYGNVLLVDQQMQLKWIIQRGYVRRDSYSEHQK